MKKLVFLLCLGLLYTSCIPLRVSPVVKDERVMKAKKFKHKLPKRYAFIFEDPKIANEFYTYINVKFSPDQNNVENNIPIVIEGETHYLSFYEVEKNTTTVNLIPIIADGILENKGHDPLFGDIEYTRKGRWYLVLTVSDESYRDSLHPDDTSRDIIVRYLKDLKKEYLNTDDYQVASLRGKL